MSDPIGIRSLRIKKTQRGLKKDLRIDLHEGVNLLVGDQGSGKTTLLEMIFNKSEDLAVDLHEHTKGNTVPIIHFDTERMNPRVAGPARELRTFDEFGTHLSLKWSSHGEAMGAILMSKLKSFHGIILIDEPESGLSIRSQFALCDALRRAQERGCQLIVATHSIILMEAFPDRLYSMEHHQPMSAKEFIAAQREPKAPTTKKPKAKRVV